MSMQSSLQTSASAESAVEMTYRQAIRQAMADALQADEQVVLLGEDIGPAGGSFKTTEGLIDEFGPERVIDTPIAENSFVGAALGMAVTGLRPVVEIMFADFLPTAGDALINEVAKFRFMSGGQARVPLTIRAIGGGTARFGTQHSATGESWYQQFPGLLVVTASSPASAYSLLRTAIRLDDPVLFIEHKAMYTHKGLVQRGDSNEAVGRANVVRQGSDVTIVATLLMASYALKAAETLAQDGIHAEVIDLRWIAPLDVATIETSLAKTGRLLIAEEQVHAGGWGATLISALVQRGRVPQAHYRAVSIPDVPLAFSPVLEDAAIPHPEHMVAAVRALLLSTAKERR